MSFTLPEHSPFMKTKEAILKNPHQFSEETLVKTQNNFRKLIWDDILDTKNINTKFYKSFSNWKNMYLMAPRLNFFGYYVLKAKYKKVGEKKEYDTIILVNYYRYLKFLPNGFVTQLLSNKKLKPDFLFNYFVHIEENKDIESFLKGSAIKPQVLKGEFILHEDSVKTRFLMKDTIFRFSFKNK